MIDHPPVDRCPRVWTSILFGSIVLLSSIAMGAERASVVLGTATKGGGFQLYGEALAAAINEADSSLHIEERATKGSKENLPLLEDGKLDIGLVEGNAAREAFDGIGRERTKLKILAAMYPNPGMFVVLADSPYRTIAHLKGKRIAWGTKDSGLRILGRDVMGGLGLDVEKDFEAVILEKAGDGPAMVMDGKVAALWGGGIGWPGFKKVAEGPKGARFIAPSAEEIKRIQATQPFLKTMSVPPDAYPGQDSEIVSVGLWAFVLARPSLPDDVAYRLARALHKAEDNLGSRLLQARYTTAANTATHAPRSELIHPGATRYLREIGALR